MCVLLITWLLRLVEVLAPVNRFNHTSWVAVVTPTDRPKSVRTRSVIELFCGVVCVVTLPFWHFCWYRGFCHRTESDPFLFVFDSDILGSIGLFSGLTSFLRYFSHIATWKQILAPWNHRSETCIQVKTLTTTRLPQPWSWISHCHILLFLQLKYSMNTCATCGSFDSQA